MDHLPPHSFFVQPAQTNAHAERLAEVIKRLEPIARAAGRTINWNKVRGTYFPDSDSDIDLNAFCSDTVPNDAPGW